MRHVYSLLPHVQLILYLFGIWNGVFGIWNGAFGIWDGVFGCTMGLV